MQPAATLPSSTTRCPFHAPHEAGAAADAAPGLIPEELLHLPLHRRAFAQFTQSAAGETGACELQVFVGDKEISFDDPAHFAFGQALVQQSHFTAWSATRWGSGYRWDEVQPLLLQLLQAGVLQRADAAPASDAPTHALTGPRPAPLPPGPCARPRMWTEPGGCEALMQELTGRPLELGWLELVLPMFRIAHAALDADGRQVGEANVFPKALRLDVPTNWRACIYGGTRYQVERPMNVSALKAMREHWGVMMALLARIRSAWLGRYPQCADAARGLTVGEIERLASCVLALPTWLLLRRDGAVPNGALHPALSCLFRVTDGLRMAMHQMLFVPIAEPTLRPDAPMTRAAILAYVERNYSLHSEHGVCAGPQAMIEEFLAVLVDGRPVADAPALREVPALADAVDHIEPALEYGLRGLRVHAAVFSLWPAMARSYERLHELLQGWSADAGPAVQQLAAQLDQRVARMRAETYVAHEQWRAEREAVYADMHAQCGRGLQLADDDDLQAQLAPAYSCRHAVADAELLDLLQRRLVRHGDGERRDRAQALLLRNELMDFFLRLQAVLQVACAEQTALNAQLGRAQPQREFDSADLDLVHRLQGAAERRLPYLVDDLADLLQLRVRITAQGLAIASTESGAQPAAAALRPDSPGMVPVEARALRT